VEEYSVAAQVCRVSQVRIFICIYAVCTPYERPALQKTQWLGLATHMVLASPAGVRWPSACTGPHAPRVCQARLPARWNTRLAARGTCTGPERRAQGPGRPTPNAIPRAAA